MNKTHILSDETGKEIVEALKALKAEKASEVLVWDAGAGHYTDESVKAYFDMSRDGLVYGYRMYKDATTALGRLGASVGMGSPVPGTAVAPGTDPTAGRGPFRHIICNVSMDPDGTPHVTAVEGDSRFSRTGSNGDVMQVHPVLYRRSVDASDHVDELVSDTPRDGYEPHPAAVLEGGTAPFMCTPVYVMGRTADGGLLGASGLPVANRDVSHDSLITKLKPAESGWGGLTDYDMWYRTCVAFYLRYYTKNSRGVFAGCTGYTAQAHPAKAEASTTRVVLSSTDAAGILVGSSLMLGSQSTVTSDRGSNNCYDVFDATRVLSKTDLGDGTVALNMDAAAPFDTDPAYLLSTAPWHSGATDAVEGDGSPTSNASGKEPYKCLGIEMAVGVYEVVGNVVISNPDGAGWQVLVNPDGERESTSSFGSYTRTGVTLVSGDTDRLNYGTHSVVASGMPVPQGSGASTSTGLCDVQYTNKASTTGGREWLAGGILWDGGDAGVSCVYAVTWLGGANWSIGSRRSGIRR